MRVHDLNINFETDEMVQFETSEAILEYNEQRINVVIVVTNKRIIFLQDINRNTVIETLNVTGKFYTLPKFEVIEQILLKEIKNYNYIENGTEIVTTDKNIFIFNYDLTMFLSV